MSRNTKADNNINSINTDDFKHSILINKLYAYVISWLPQCHAITYNYVLKQFSGSTHT